MLAKQVLIPRLTTSQSSATKIRVMGSLRRSLSRMLTPQMPKGLRDARVHTIFEVGSSNSNKGVLNVSPDLMHAKGFGSIFEPANMM